MDLRADGAVAEQQESATSAATQKALEEANALAEKAQKEAADADARTEEAQHELAQAKAELEKAQTEAAARTEKVMHTWCALTCGNAAHDMTQLSCLSIVVARVGLVSVSMLTRSLAVISSV